ncbi:unnamed protein product [Durusdinium trenchii]|uniref:Uncharacterized protein n=2 Tax=Durusdinium trenchii TaxID=1381693 RepID=A0ABP0MA52_9DINO
MVFGGLSWFGLRSPMSLPSLPPLSMPLHQIYSRRWTTESKRYLHVAKERKWMALQHKHRFLDFSPKERAELKRYFDELAGENRKIALDQLETMFISLGLAEHPKDVQGWTERVDDLQLGELDFEQFLELLLKRTDSDLVSLFREMASGKLGDPSLNFQTIISEYRRKLIMGAAGVGNIGRQQLGSKVLHNFAALQRSRWEAQAAKDQAQAMGLKSGEAAADFNTNSTRDPPVGGLEMIWRGVCAENDLWPTRSMDGAAEGRTKQILEQPPSPEEILEKVHKHYSPKKSVRPFGTVIIPADLGS